MKLTKLIKLSKLPFYIQQKQTHSLSFAGRLMWHVEVSNGS